MAVTETYDRVKQVVPDDIREELQSLWTAGFEESGRPTPPLEWDVVVGLKADPIIAREKITIRRTLVIGRFSRIDPNCYISPKLIVGKHSHIAHNVTIGGGNDEVEVTLGDHVGLAAGSRIYAISDDPQSDPFSAYPSPLNQLFREGIRGNVTFKNYSGVALNAVVLPGSVFEEGAFVLPLSQVAVNSVLEPWVIYAGAGKDFRAVGRRDSEKVLQKTDRIERFAELAFQVQALLGLQRE